NPRALAGAGQPDMGKAAFFFKSGATAFVERALMRKQTFLPSGQEYTVEFEALGRMQRHDVDGLLSLATLAVHDEGDVLQKSLKVLELLHGAHELLEVFQPAGGIGGTVFLPHVGIAALVEHDLG